jgi:hypothetical protein
MELEKTFFTLWEKRATLYVQNTELHVSIRHYLETTFLEEADVSSVSLDAKKTKTNSLKTAKCSAKFFLFF